MYNNKIITFIIISLFAISNTIYPMASAWCYTIPAMMTYAKIKAQNAQDANEYSTPINNCSKTKGAIQKLLKTYAPRRCITISVDEHPLNEFTHESAKINGITLSHSKIIVTPQLRDLLSTPDNPNHYTAEAVMGHELGHAYNYHPEKTLAMAWGIASIGAVSAYAIRQTEPVKNRSWLDTLIKWAIPIATNALIIKAAQVYAQKNERDADYHVIKYAKEPRVLHAMAQHYKKEASEEGYSWTPQDAHPHALERAAYFDKAAEELEAKLKEAL